MLPCVCLATSGVLVLKALFYYCCHLLFITRTTSFQSLAMIDCVTVVINDDDVGGHDVCAKCFFFFWEHW